MADESISVDVSQLETLARQFDSASGRLGADTSNAVRQAAKTVQKTARDLVPVDKGNLKRSIGITYEGDGRSAEMSAIVGTPFFTGRFVENGTAFQQPHPFMAPALEAGREEFEKAVDSAVKKAI